MNPNEKRALYSFLTIYTLSALVLMGIIALLYYNKAVHETKTACKKDLQSTILSVEMDLRKACMYDQNFTFDPAQYKLHVGLFDASQKPLASNLLFHDINFTKMSDIKPNRVQMVKKLQQPLLNIRYIVAEDVRIPAQLHSLKILIALTMLISLLFVALIGYFLSRLLLRPVKERVAELNRFIKDATHEINTPVTALLMSVSALKKKGSHEEKLLRHISISAKQISNIYNTLSHISFAEHKKEKIVYFDLKKEILKNVTFFKEIASAKKITIQTDLHSTYITMDKESASKLINNLLSNAIKYSFSNTTITVTLKEGKLSVKDEGIGINKADQKKILKRYSRIGTLGGGFGIGLDIVNTICQKYGILLHIDSKEKAGATFTLDFASVQSKR